MKFPQYEKLDIIKLHQQAAGDDGIYIDMMNYELKRKFYHKGEHFKHSTGNFSHWQFFKTVMLEFFLILLRRLKPLPMLDAVPMVVSAATPNHDRSIRADNKFNVLRAPWAISRSSNLFFSLKLFWLARKIYRDIYSKNFNTLVSADFIQTLKKFERLYKDFLIKHDVKAIFLPADVSIYERISIKCAKDLGIKSVLLAHGGFPNIYDGKMDNRTDILIHWGPEQLEAYKKMGFAEEKLFYSGHPFYRKVPQNLRFDFEDILVFTKSLCGVSPLENMFLEDHAQPILYLKQLQAVLEGFGVKKVRLRPHPSENKDWYLQFIDRHFYQMDDDSLSSALAKSSLVIGPISTGLIDAMANEVNYLIFEPLNEEGVTLQGYPLAPPLDGKNPKLPVATSQEELKQFLSTKRSIDLSVYEEIAPTKFDLSYLPKLIQ